MYRQKIITNWVLLVIGVTLYFLVNNFALQMFIILIFGGITSANRGEINKAHNEHEDFNYFHELGAVTKTIIIMYFTIITPSLLWLAVEQPGTIDSLFYGKYSLIMLLGVLAPIIIPLLASVIKDDLELIKNEKL